MQRTNLQSIEANQYFFRRNRDLWQSNPAFKEFTSEGQKTKQTTLSKSESFAKKILYLLFLGIFASSAAQAQLKPAGNYSFTATTGTYTPLGASATAVSTILDDSELSGALPIGFTFNFEGTDFTTVKASSNGFLTFNPTATSSETTNNIDNVSSSSRPLVAPLWDDLDGRATGGSFAGYEVTGTAGSRVFTFEWRNWEWRWNSDDPVISFQAKLYEGTNVIEFIYRQESGSVVATSTNGASIGITGASTGDGNYLSLNNSSANPTVSSTSETANINTKPATGQVYRFTPPVLPAKDAGVTALIAPVANSCFSTTESVTVSIINMGADTLTSIPVEVKVSGTTTQTLNGTFTGSLASGASVDFTLPGTVDMSVAGNYDFLAYTQLAGDTVTGNDTLTTVTITNTIISTFPHTEDFESFSTGTNATGYANGWSASPSGTTSSFRWNIDTNGTPSSDTGPDIDHTLGTSSGKYVFTEATSGSSGDAALLESPCVNLASLTTPGVEFWYHMYGGDMGDLHVDIWNGTQWDSSVYVISGQQQTSETDAWKKAKVNLSAYTGSTIKVRFRGVKGSSFEGDMAIDDVKFFDIPATDAALTAFVSPTLANCFGSSETVTVMLKNDGGSAISNLPVTVSVTGPVSSSLPTATFTGTLAPDSSVMFTVGNIDMSVAGVYNLMAVVNLSGDTIATNDTIRLTITNSVISSFPHTEDFESFSTGTDATGYANGWTTTPSGTTSSFRWNIDTNGTPSSDTGPDVDHTLGTSSGKYVFTEASSGSTGDVAILESPCINLTSLTAPGLEFWYHRFGGDMGDMHVDIWNGTQWDSSVFVLTGQQQTSVTDAWKSAKLNLSAYTGSTIKVRFRGIRGADFEGDMAIDDFRIYELPDTDAGIVTLNTPVAIQCFSSSEAVTATIVNQGGQVLDFTTKNTIVKVNVTGAVTQTLADTLTTGTLAAGASQLVTIGNLDMSAAGTYNFEIVVLAPGDTLTSNDTIFSSFEVVAPVALPEFVDFTGFTGSNLDNVFPNWHEASGTTPMGTSSTWTDQTGLGGSGNVTARINLFTDSRNEWIVGPKFIPAANDELRFKAAVTNWNSTTASDQMGSDDKVRVMISTDCGATWNAIFTMDTTSNLTTTLTEQIVPLSAYAGQEVIVAFYATDGPVDDSEDYDFHLDDIMIGAPLDVAGDSVIVPATVCGTGNIPVTVSIRNNGVAPLDFTTNNVSITTGVSGAGTQQLSVTLTDNSLNNNLPLAPNTTLEVPVGTLNATTTGSYTLSTVARVTTGGTDPNLQNDTIQAVTITVNALPVVNLGNDTTQCGGTVTLDAGNAGATYLWSDNSTAQTLTVNATGTYWVDVTNANGCTTRDSIDVTINSLPTVALGNDTSICAGSTLTLDAGNAGATFLWSDNSTAQTLAVTAAGTYWVEVTNANGCMSADTIVVTTNALPTIALGNDTTICAGSTLTLDAGNAGATYLWSDNSTAQTLAVTTAGTYWVDVTNTSGCTSRDSITVSVSALPTVALGNDTTICPGTTLTLDAGNAGATYLWSDNSTTQTLAVTAAGTYWVNVTNVNGCVSSDTIVVSQSPATVASFTAAPSGLGATFSNTGSTGAGFSYSWNFGDTNTSTQENPTHTYAAIGTYTVQLVVTGPCGADTATQIISIVSVKDQLAGKSVSVYPNPTNGLVKVDLNGYAGNVELVVFTTTGQQVMSSQITANNDLVTKELNLSNMPTGVYILKAISGSEVQFHKIIVE